jgi:hypothetical protein
MMQIFFGNLSAVSIIKLHFFHSPFFPIPVWVGSVCTNLPVISIVYFFGAARTEKLLLRPRSNAGQLF